MITHHNGPVDGFPVYHWDTPGLPPRTKAQRCANHKGMCAYRDDDPAYCPRCHRSWVKIAQESGKGISHGCLARKPRADEDLWEDELDDGIGGAPLCPIPDCGRERYGTPLCDVHAEDEQPALF